MPKGSALSVVRATLTVMARPRESTASGISRAERWAQIRRSTMVGEGRREELEALELGVHRVRT